MKTDDKRKKLKILIVYIYIYFLLYVFSDYSKFKASRYMKKLCLTNIPFFFFRRSFAYIRLKKKKYFYNINKNNI